jgi:hypothetical protein
MTTYCSQLHKSKGSGYKCSERKRSDNKSCFLNRQTIMHWMRTDKKDHAIEWLMRRKKI